VTTTAIILAAGEQKRWANTVGYKQLLAVGGEPVIYRTERLCLQELGIEPWVAVRNDTMEPFGLMRYFYPYQFRWICETLINTSEVWSDTTVILLGDVYYTEQFFFRVIHDNKNVWFGDGGEIYALKFGKLIAGLIKNSLFESIENAKHGGKGKLWQAYRSFEGYGLEEHKFGPHFWKKPDSDMTRDFDRPEVYSSFIREFEKVKA